MSSSEGNGPKARMRHLGEMRIFATLTILAVAVALIGFGFGEASIFFAGLAFALFAVMGVFYALAKERRWLE